MERGTPKDSCIFSVDIISGTLFRGIEESIATTDSVITVGRASGSYNGGKQKDSMVAFDMSLFFDENSRLNGKRSSSLTRNPH
ncbi:hypothetical protein Avbf_16194 [Armadillidium vulgare]|nr:hypothetical protein Avbf_16194 [Armadillidium vulgare]